jgi:hypothetical protein
LEFIGGFIANLKSAENKFMRKIFLLLLSLLALVNALQAQQNGECGVEEMSLLDPAKFEKANKCKSYVKTDQKPKKLPEKVELLKVVTVTELVCGSFDNKKGLWVTLLSELQSVYQEKPLEFGQTENRLKKLIGLKENETYHCLIVLEASSDSLEVPQKGDSGYPFTGLGFTCDWYYGDGCRYGLSEFTLKKKAKQIAAYEINNCNVEKFLGAKCGID